MKMVTLYLLLFLFVGDLFLACAQASLVDLAKDLQIIFKDRGETLFSSDSASLIDKAFNDIVEGNRGDRNFYLKLRNLQINRDNNNISIELLANIRDLIHEFYSQILYQKDYKNAYSVGKEIKELLNYESLKEVLGEAVSLQHQFCKTEQLLNELNNLTQTPALAQIQNNLKAIAKNQPIQDQVEFDKNDTKFITQLFQVVVEISKINNQEECQEKIDQALRLSNILFERKQQLDEVLNGFEQYIKDNFKQNGYEQHVSVEHKIDTLRIIHPFWQLIQKEIIEKIDRQKLDPKSYLYRIKELYKSMPLQDYTQESINAALNFEDPSALITTLIDLTKRIFNNLREGIQGDSLKFFIDQVVRAVDAVLAKRAEILSFGKRFVASEVIKRIPIVLTMKGSFLTDLDEIVKLKKIELDQRPILKQNLEDYKKLSQEYPEDRASTLQEIERLMKDIESELFPRAQERKLRQQVHQLKAEPAKQDEFQKKQEELKRQELLVLQEGRNILQAALKVGIEAYQEKIDKKSKEPDVGPKFMPFFNCLKGLKRLAYNDTIRPVDTHDQLNKNRDDVQDKLRAIDAGLDSIEKLGRAGHMINQLQAKQDVGQLSEQLQSIIDDFNRLDVERVDLQDAIFNMQERAAQFYRDIVLLSEESGPVEVAIAHVQNMQANVDSLQNSIRQAQEGVSSAMRVFNQFKNVYASVRDNVARPFNAIGSFYTNVYNGVYNTYKRFFP